jgi:hypothetical protein
MIHTKLYEEDGLIGDRKLSFDHAAALTYHFPAKSTVQQQHEEDLMLRHHLQQWTFPSSIVQQQQDDPTAITHVLRRFSVDGAMQSDHDGVTAASDSLKLPPLRNNIQ